MNASYRPALLAMTTAALLTAPWQTVTGGAQYRTMAVSAQVSPSISIVVATPPQAFAAPPQADELAASRTDAGDVGLPPEFTTQRTGDASAASGVSMISVNSPRARPEVVVEFTADVTAFASAELSAETSFVPGERIAVQWGPQQVREVLNQVAVTVLRYRLRNGNGNAPASLALPVLVTISL